jgi:hypothetical protein
MMFPSYDYEYGDIIVIDLQTVKNGSFGSLVLCSFTINNTLNSLVTGKMLINSKPLYSPSHHFKGPLERLLESFS